MKIECKWADSLVIKGAAGLLAKGHIDHVSYEENIL